MTLKIVVATLLAAGVLHAEPAQIILFRHAEKPIDDAVPHLSIRGRERAAALAVYLDSFPVFTNWGRPVAIFAAAPTSDAPSERPIATVTPYSTRIGVPIDTSYTADQFRLLAMFVRTNEAYAGKTVVICWPHDQIPAFAHDLGVARPPSWKASDFNHIWLFRYTDGRLRFLKIAERLLFGDRT